jgi:hypothetical protein
MAACVARISLMTAACASLAMWLLHSLQGWLGATSVALSLTLLGAVLVRIEVQHDACAHVLMCLYDAALHCFFVAATAALHCSCVQARCLCQLVGGCTSHARKALHVFGISWWLNC